MWSKSGDRPKDVPSNPDQHYGCSWEDFLGFNEEIRKKRSNDDDNDDDNDNDDNSKATSRVVLRVRRNELNRAAPSPTPSFSTTLHFFTEAPPRDIAVSVGQKRSRGVAYT